MFGTPFIFLTRKKVQFFSEFFYPSALAPEALIKKGFGGKRANLRREKNRPVFIDR